MTSVKKGKLLGMYVKFLKYKTSVKLWRGTCQKDKIDESRIAWCHDVSRALGGLMDLWICEICRLGIIKVLFS